MSGAATHRRVAGGQRAPPHDYREWVVGASEAAYAATAIMLSTESPAATDCIGCEPGVDRAPVFMPSSRSSCRSKSGGPSNDAAADRLGALSRHPSIHESGLSRERNACCLNHPDTGCRSKGREVARRRSDVFLRGIHRDGVHAVAGNPTGRRTPSRRILECRHLRDDVVCGQAGQVGVFGPSHSIWEMTVGARKELRCAAMRNDIRHRRMSAWVPVRWRESIDDLRQREPRATVGDAVRPRAIGDRGICRAAGESPERCIRLLKHGKSDRKHSDDRRQDWRQPLEVFHCIRT